MFMILGGYPMNTLRVSNEFFGLEENNDYLHRHSGFQNVHQMHLRKRSYKSSIRLDRACRLSFFSIFLMGEYSTEYVFGKKLTSPPKRKKNAACRVCFSLVPYLLKAGKELSLHPPDSSHVSYI